MYNKFMIIAEIGTSHEGSLEKAKQLIDSACSSGADYIKTQIVIADEILHPKTGFVDLPTGKIPLYDRFKQLECDINFYKKFVEYVHDNNKLFIASPFGIKSLEILYSLKPDAIKIASPELNHYKLLQKVKLLRQQDNNKMPLILSSGVSTLSDIEKALSIVGKENVYLLHCITSYPAKESEYNLSLIKNLSNIFGIPCGVSDHSLDPILVPVLSITQNCKFIEKHFTLSKKTLGLDDPVALEPEQFAFMCHAVNQAKASIEHYGETEGAKRIISQLEEQFDKNLIQKTLGDGIKKLALCEKDNYKKTNRSLHYTNSFKASHIITENDIAILRTEKILSCGISPEYFNLLIGKKLTSDVVDGDGVQLSDFMS